MSPLPDTVCAASPTPVRPLAIKYSRYKSLAILFALLLNRIEFLREADKVGQRTAVL